MKEFNINLVIMFVQGWHKVKILNSFCMFCASSIRETHRNSKELEN